MIRKILAIKESDRIWTVLLENGKITEIHVSPLSAKKAEPAVGDIYIGKVMNLVPNIGAAFVDIGGVNCYYDVSQAEYALFTKKCGKKPLCIGDELVVQISREAAKTKGPTVTSNLNFSGHYAVITSGNTRLGVSSKIPRAQRERIKEALQGLQNDDYGIIVRTNARDADEEEVRAEIQTLAERLEKIKREAVYRTCFSCLEAAPKAYITDFKNAYTDGLEEILVEDTLLYEELSVYFKKELPELLPKLKLYEDHQVSLANLYNVKSNIERALNERVWLPNGGYLVIQPTEALTVVDVNSGKCVAKKKTGDAQLKLNLEAAKEIARQIRLRNLSGIIIIDFVNLDDEEQTRMLLKEFRKFLSADPIPASLVDVTALQLVEVTRKKVRKPLHECWREL